MTAPCPLPTYPVYRSATQAKAARRHMHDRQNLRVIRCDGHAHVVMYATDHTNRTRETR